MKRNLYTFSATLLLLMLTLTPATLFAQDQSRWLVNVVKVKPGMLDHAHRYYRQAWVPAREAALRKGVISSYRMLTLPTEGDTFEIILLTGFKDEAQFAAGEAAFEKIFDEIGLDGPPTVDGKSRADIIAETEGAIGYRSLESGGNLPR
jgi:hypothetical protein